MVILRHKHGVACDLRFLEIYNNLDNGLTDVGRVEREAHFYNQCLSSQPQSPHGHILLLPMSGGETMLTMAEACANLDSAYKSSRHAEAAKRHKQMMVFGWTSLRAWWAYNVTRAKFRKLVAPVEISTFLTIMKLFFLMPREEVDMSSPQRFLVDIFTSKSNRLNIPNRALMIPIIKTVDSPSIESQWHLGQHHVLI
ncbi:hypothetical protein VNO77_27723 [Canavalia gladiata]|uniref:Uncharacterized protein n=1 Tax=Canavalia gladiata TaxID=3824 RepID=A0AAN9Q6R2_CANGL